MILRFAESLSLQQFIDIANWIYGQQGNLGSPIKVLLRPSALKANQSLNKINTFLLTQSPLKTTAYVAKLLSRYWLITANGKEVEVQVKGLLVKRQQLPLEKAKYTSGAVRYSVGTMQGHYTMRNEFGTEFEAPIEVFRLARPTYCIR